MRVEFQSNLWRSWTVYHSSDGMEKTIIRLLDDRKHFNFLLANYDFNIDETIEYSDALARVDAKLGAILG